MIKVTNQIGKELRLSRFKSGFQENCDGGVCPWNFDGTDERDGD